MDDIGGLITTPRQASVRRTDARKTLGGKHPDSHHQTAKQPTADQQHLNAAVTGQCGGNHRDGVTIVTLRRIGNTRITDLRVVLVVLGGVAPGSGLRRG